MQHGHCSNCLRTVAVPQNRWLELALKVGVPLLTAIATRDAKTTAASALGGFALHEIERAIAKRCPICGVALELAEVVVRS